MFKSKIIRIEEGEPPEKKLISQGDILIKQLVQKQQNVNISLQEHLSNKKEFITGLEYVPLDTVGKCSLENFEHLLKNSEVVGKLKAAGLTQSDINIYLNNKNGTGIQKQHKNLSPFMIEERIHKIEEIIKEHETQLEKSRQNLASEDLNRTEPGLAVKPQSLETKLLQFALGIEKSKCKDTLSYPIEKVKELNDRIKWDTETTTPSIKKIRRKARKLRNRINNVCEKEELLESKQKEIVSLAKESKWDIKDAAECEKPKLNKVYSCQPVNYYTIKNGVIEKLNKEIPLPVDCSRKLTIEEIRKISRFENYEPGIPSKTLFLKNLPNSVTEEELRQVFANCERNDEVIYKVMKGWMRGQAFLEFPDIFTATGALNKINGTIIKNKPIIIHFAKTKNKSSNCELP